MSGLSVGRTRASGKRDAQASSAVGLLRRHLILYSRRGVCDTARRMHTHTRALSAHGYVCTRGYTKNTCASSHSVPFRHSIRARLASKLSPMVGSLATARHAALVSCLFSTCATRVRAWTTARRRRSPIGKDRLSALGLECLFLSETSDRGPVTTTIPHTHGRELLGIIENWY